MVANILIVASVLLAAASIASTIYFADEEVDLTVLSTSLFMVLCILVPASVAQISLLVTTWSNCARRRSMTIAGLAIATIAIATVFTLRPAVIHDVIRLMR